MTLRIVPRKGIFVADYQRHGGIDILDVLFTDSPRLDHDIFLGMMQARDHLETEFAALAARNRREEHLKRLEAIVAAERQATGLDEIAALDFDFHHEIAHATQNAIYPMILKSMTATYQNLVRAFYETDPDRNAVLDSHSALLEAITRQNAEEARRIMTAILAYGFQCLNPMHEEGEKTDE